VGDQVGRQRQYGKFADRFLDHAGNGFFNARYGRPACLALLGDGGALVLSRQHRAGDWLRHGGSYFDARVIQETWSRGWSARYWLAPLQATCEEIFDAGFLIERLLDPRPTPEATAIDPDEYERLSRQPRGFLAFRLRPRR